MRFFDRSRDERPVPTPPALPAGGATFGEAERLLAAADDAMRATLSIDRRTCLEATTQRSGQ
jgi:hypothetical protein